MSERVRAHQCRLIAAIGLSTPPHQKLRKSTKENTTITAKHHIPLGKYIQQRVKLSSAYSAMISRRLSIIINIRRSLRFRPSRWDGQHINALTLKVSSRLPNTPNSAHRHDLTVSSSPLCELILLCAYPNLCSVLRGVSDWGSILNAMFADELNN